jgi:2-aminoadipate transaminase
MNAPTRPANLLSAGTLPLARRAREGKSSVIREILKVAQRPDVISFAGGLPAPESFPLDALRRAFDEVLREVGPAALQYSTTEGHPALREWLAARETAAGLPTTPDQVLIVSGSQQGLDLIGKAFIDDGAKVLVESPTYLGAMQAFAMYGARCTELACDDAGIVPDRIDGTLAAGARFAYVMPTFSNPTGRTLSAQRRSALAAAARRFDLLLVEDDPYGELYYRAAPPSGLRHHAPERTVRLGSFSKILAPGLRIGYVIGPPAVIDVLVRLKQATDLHTATLAQQAACRVLASGLLDTHLPAVRARYASQCQVMLDALAEHMPAGASWTKPDGGMFVWLELPAALDGERLLPLAIEQRLAFVPGSAFFAASPRRNTLRLSFVTVSPERIRAGVAALGRLVRAALP